MQASPGFAKNFANVKITNNKFANLKFTVKIFYYTICTYVMCSLGLKILYPGWPLKEKFAKHPSILTHEVKKLLHYICMVDEYDNLLAIQSSKFSVNFQQYQTISILYQPQIWDLSNLPYQMKYWLMYFNIYLHQNKAQICGNS